VGPSRRVRTGVDAVLAEEGYARARLGLDAAGARDESAPSLGGGHLELIRVVALLMGAGIGAIAGTALGDRPTGVALGVVVGLLFPALMG